MDGERLPRKFFCSHKYLLVYHGRLPISNHDLLNNITIIMIRVTRLCIWGLSLTSLEPRVLKVLDLPTTQIVIFQNHNAIENFQRSIFHNNNIKTDNQNIIFKNKFTTIIVVPKYLIGLFYSDSDKDNHLTLIDGL